MLFKKLKKYLINFRTRWKFIKNVLINKKTEETKNTGDTNTLFKIDEEQIKVEKEKKL